MKQVIAVIKPFLAQKVLEALPSHLLEAVQIREVQGYGRQKSYLDQYEESEFARAFVPKVEITLWVDDDSAEEIAAAIASTSRTGRIGDGKIMILDAHRAL